MPFLVDDELKRLRSRYEKCDDWADFTVVDGWLIHRTEPGLVWISCRGLLKLLRA